MDFDYAGLRDEVVEPLIEEFGKDATIAVNEPATSGGGSSQIDSETLHPARVVQTQFKKTDNSGTLVEAGDVLYLVSTRGVTIDPDLANRMIVHGVTYQIIRVDPLRPGPVTMLWKIHARK